MPFAQQVRLRNPGKNTLVVTPDPDRPKAYLRFEGAGDELQGDEHYVSRESVQQPDLIKAIQRGLLVVEGLDPEDPLVPVLRARPRMEKPERPLTAIRVVHEMDGDDWVARDVEIPVPVLPLVRL